LADQLAKIQKPLLVLFWLAFYALGLLVLLMSVGSFGKTAPVALLVQAACSLWLTATVLHVLRSKLAYMIAGIWVLMLGLPLAFQVVRRLHYWAIIGMEAPDGMGSPLAFLIGFIFEWVIFFPLCLMLAVLILFRPWRNDQRRVSPNQRLQLTGDARDAL
jgi:hypothetical protein